jgi:hypothetical protein
MIRTMLYASILLFCGCKTMEKSARITTREGIKIEAADNAASPTTIERSEKKTEVKVGAGTKATTPTGTIEYPAITATIVEHVVNAAASHPKAPDKSVEMFNAKAGESRPLLYASMVSVVLGVIAIAIGYTKMVATICFLASAAFFAAWKVSNLPDWFWAVGAVLLAAAVFTVFGHEKGERHAAHRE